MITIENITNETTEDENTQEKQPFRVTDLSSANWCFKKIKNLKNKQKELDGYIETERQGLEIEAQRIQEHYEKETNKIKEDISYFEGLLKIYVEERQEEDPKFKLSTVDGTASFGKLQQKIKYDDGAMLDFCKQNNLDKFINITTTEKLNKKEFNNYLSVIDGKVVTADGEILQNTFIEEIQNFNVKTK